MARKASKILSLALCCFLSPSQLLAQDLEKIAVKKIEFSPQNNLEITLDKKTEFKAFYLQNPDRLVVDIVNAEAAKPVFECALPDFVKSHREGLQKNSLRLVFDLNQKISVNKSSYQKLKDQDFGRIIIELEGIEKAAAQSNDSRYRLTNDQNKPAKIVIPKTPIIVIDPGHGGKDPGTIGDYARTKEKNLTLAYAKELKKSLENTKHYKVYLTRDEDLFIPLQDRVEKARKLKADLFISLHANSIAQASTKGFSIYTLSKKSSDKQAEMLAQKENRVDILAGVNFSGASPDIMKTLIDLSQRDSMNSSSRFANIVIRALSKSEIKVLQNTHRFAGFAVLTAPDMSSVLIELGYLSNQHEEKQLNNLIYKRKIVASIINAINEYFHKNLKPTQTASKHE
jgi:N-acetylmuramoyl-L-alanine amidase